MISDEEIIRELNTINQISTNLQPRAVYLAGCMRTKTFLGTQVIYTFINRLYESVKAGAISAENQYKIESKLYQGSIGEANEMLNSLPLVKIPIKPPPEVVIPSPMEIPIIIPRPPAIVKPPAPVIRLPPEPIEIPKGPNCGYCTGNIPLENRCSLRSCTHYFHRVCLNSYFESQINAEIVDILCPQDNCKKSIQPADIQNHVSNELMKIYNDYAFKKRLLKGEFGNIIKCPNNLCSEIFELTDVDSMCPKCKYLICGRCKTLKNLCSCNPKPKAKPPQNKLCKHCYRIIRSVPNSKLHYCDRCNIYYCSICESKRNECTCGFASVTYQNCPVCRDFIQVRDGLERVHCQTCNYVICLKCRQMLNNCLCPGYYFQ
ncbi:unnamed protein product [Blepharisma stoltei]|uniref:RBR-type E3 ubiquitin transferase n=1 Tax=Blepharisma stoltei TaxID=1481888 RepID=A0AAU9J9R9_9CILI|nr:unnamed protein product [Blepharisma stoltei]